jgi:hypothetical protein
MTDSDIYGRPQQHRPNVTGMLFPVRCAHRWGVYDMGAVEVTARYTDCSVWKSPCCGLTVDDRGAGWKVRADFVRLDACGREVRS